MIGQTIEAPLKRLSNVSLVMAASVNVKVGDRLYLPYRFEWAVGEPSAWKDFCGKYMSKDCTLRKILVREIDIAGCKSREIRFLVKFDDGFEREINSEALVAWNARGVQKELVTRSS